MAKIKPLRQCPLFKGFSDREIAAFSQVVDEYDLPVGAMLSQMDPAFVLVRNGHLKGTWKAKGSFHGRTVFLKDGEFFGELALLSAVREAGDWEFVAESEAGILSITSAKFFELNRREPDLFVRVVRAMAGAVGQQIRSVALETKPGGKP